MSIIKTVESVFAGSKGITDAGRTAAKNFGESINGNTIKTNLGKFGLVPAVAGGGVGLGIVGIGAGVAATSNIVADGVKNAFSLDLSNIEKSTSKITGWLVLGGIILGGVFLYRFATGKGKK